MACLLPCGDVVCQGLRRIRILRTFDLIDFPGSVFGSAEAGDGEFAMVADLVEDVFSFGDGDEVLFEAKLVGGRDLEQVLGAVEEADGSGLGQRSGEVAEVVLNSGLQEAVPVAAEPTGSAMGFVEIRDAASLAEQFPDAPTDAVMREEIKELSDATQRDVGRLSDAAELAKKGPAQREYLVLAEAEHPFIDGAGGVGKPLEREWIGKRLADQLQMGADHVRCDAREQSDGLAGGW